MAVLGFTLGSGQWGGHNCSWVGTDLYCHSEPALTSGKVCFIINIGVQGTRIFYWGWPPGPPFEPPLLAERSWPRPATFATGTHAKLREVLRCQAVQAPIPAMHSLKVTHCGTSGQWSLSWRMCVRPRANFHVVVTLAAALKPRCSLSVAVLGAVASIELH